MSARMITAETAEGRCAIEEVMAHCYQAEVSDVSPAWARVLAVDEVPVSFVLVNPDDAVALPGGRLRAAFIGDAGTREDRRREGHFRRLMEMTYADLRAEGISLLTLHGNYHYYRPLGFDVWTHHCGPFITPDIIERQLGTAPAAVREDLLEVDDHPFIAADRLVVSDVCAWTAEDTAVALLAAAAMARTRGKTRIIFQHPRADHSLHPSLETPFAEFARLCGAEQIVLPDDPEGQGIEDGDWMKVLDTYQLLRDAVPLRPVKEEALPKVAVTFDTDAGTATLRVSTEGLTVVEGAASDAYRVTWPANAVGQLVLGYLSAPALAALQGTPIPQGPLALLDAVFPRWWRLSRNEGWVFGQW